MSKTKLTDFIVLVKKNPPVEWEIRDNDDNLLGSICLSKSGNFTAKIPNAKFDTLADAHRFISNVNRHKGAKK